MFGFSGENLTKRLRSKGFKTMLSQEIAWFDSPDNNVGKICTRLAVEAAAVQGVWFIVFFIKFLIRFKWINFLLLKATGIRIGAFIMNIGNFGVGLIIAMVYGWALTLLILGLQFGFICFSLTKL